MPLYDYECENPECDETQEVIHPYSGPEERIICPTCGDWMKKVPSRPGPPIGGGTPKFYPNRG